MVEADAVVAALGLAPHPEGGWYRETWRAPAVDGARSAGTSILFLLDAGQTTHWHRVDATELWLFHAGSSLTLRLTGETIRLGPDPLVDRQQAVVPAGAWQAATAEVGWALVGCVVVPGFDFAGFELAPADFDP